MNPAAILYEDFQPGTLMGEQTEFYDDSQVRRWQAIFGDEAGIAEDTSAEAASMVVINMMRAYLNVVAPRPAGNVHARQKLQLHAVPRKGEAMRVTVSCLNKEERRSRKYVELQVQGRGDNDRPLFEGLLTLIWAA